MGRQTNPYIKKAGQQDQFSYEQLQELRRCARDPIYFIKNYVKIQHPKKGAVPFQLYDYQEKMIKAYMDNRYTIVLSARQTGKALELNTQIPTPTGWTTMGDIRVGDQVLGADGNPTTVTAISPIQKNRTCYKITLDTNDSVIADAEHLWEVRDEYTRKAKVLTTQEMVDVNYVNEKNQARFTIKTTKPLKLPKQNLKIDPYVLGVWLGDGNSRTSEFTFHQDDIQILEEVSKVYETNNRPAGRDRTHIRTSTVYKLRPKLREIGVLNNKHIPITYKRSSFDQRLSLLQGLMDTDGTVDGLGRGQCEITLSNQILAKDVYELISSLGLKPTFKSRTVNGFVRYEVKFSAYREQLQVFRLKRKLDKMKTAPHPSRANSIKKRSIQKIEKVDSVLVKCIKVDNEDSLFLFGRGMIPTHNSVTSGAYLLWYAMFNFDKTILIASNKNSNAMEMIYRIRYAYENLPMWLKPGVMDDGWNKHNVGFDNNSRIVSTATSAEAGRGMAISLLFLDEFAFVQPSIQAEFWTSIAPTLSTGGSCIMTSTPNGDMNLFAQLWRQAHVDPGGFHPIEVKWNEPPGRDNKFKAEQVSKIGQDKWDQEYECQFLSSDSLLIDSRCLQTWTKRLEMVRPTFTVKDVVFYEDIQEGGTYMIGVDPSTGSGRDYSIISVWQFPDIRQVAEFRSNTMSSPDLYDTLKNVLRYIESKQTTVYFSIENNGVGEGLIALFQNDEEPPANSEFVCEDGKSRLGFTTTGRSKLRCCINLKEMIEKDKIEFKSNVLLSELKSFTRSQGSYNAQSGSSDDCISAVLIVLRILEEIAAYDQTAFDKLYSIGVEEWEEDDFNTYDEDSFDAPLPSIF